MSINESLNNNQVEKVDTFNRFDPAHFEQDVKQDYRFGALGRMALMLSRGRQTVLDSEKVKAKEWAEKASYASENRGPVQGQEPDEGLFQNQKPYSHREAQTALYNSRRTNGTEDLEPLQPKGYQTPTTDRRSLTPGEATNIGAGLFSREEIQHGLDSGMYDDEPNHQNHYDRAA